MSERDEDATWQAIVDNYGDRPTLPHDDVTDPAVSGEVHDLPGTDLSPAVDSGERFVAPDPGPVALPPTPRLIAWLSVLGAPLATFGLAMFAPGVSPKVLGVLVVAFLAGFSYLVLQLPKRPGDPFDDGARL